MLYKGKYFHVVDGVISANVHVRMQVKAGIVLQDRSYWESTMPIY